MGLSNAGSQEMGAGYWAVPWPRAVGSRSRQAAVSSVEGKSSRRHRRPAGRRRPRPMTAHRDAGGPAGGQRPRRRRPGRRRPRPGSAPRRTEHPRLENEPSIVRANARAHRHLGQGRAPARPRRCRGRRAPVPRFTRSRTSAHSARCSGRSTAVERSAPLIPAPGPPRPRQLGRRRADQHDRRRRRPSSGPGRP